MILALNVLLMMSLRKDPAAELEFQETLRTVKNEVERRFW